MTIRETIEKNEEKYLSPYAVLSKNTKGRQNKITPCDMRTEFQRDRDRIIYSNSFKRLKNKTQVFCAPEGDHFITRMTKSVEDIMAIILTEYPDAQEIFVTTGQDGNNTYYDAVFVTPEFAAEVKMNPVTGAFSEREYVFF